MKLRCITALIKRMYLICITNIPKLKISFYLTGGMSVDQYYFDFYTVKVNLGLPWIID